MEGNIYNSLLITAMIIEVGVIVTVIVAVLITLFHRSEKSLKNENDKIQSFLRLMYVESQKNRQDVERMIDENQKETVRILDEIQKSSRDNAVFILCVLRQIFEIFDRDRDKFVDKSEK